MILVMVLHLRSSMLISALLPLAVLMCFIAMKTFGVDANIVALSGIAIAIGTMVDMGIILCENILKHLGRSRPGARIAATSSFRASHEVAGAVLTAVSTTVVSFLPVFTMIAAEGKLFRPLAFTKTFALAASVIVALTIIPPAAHILMGRRSKKGSDPNSRNGLQGASHYWGLTPFSIVMIGLVIAGRVDRLACFLVGRSHRRWVGSLQAGGRAHSGELPEIRTVRGECRRRRWLSVCC